MKKLIALLLFVPVLASLASDPYIQPGGLNQPIYRWLYPDFVTMNADDSFFSQDIGKLAFVPNNSFPGWGALYQLGATTPQWAWIGGDPLRYNGSGILNVTFPSANLGEYVIINNLNSGATATSGLRISSNAAVATFTEYSSAYVGGPPNAANGLSISNGVNPIIFTDGTTNLMQIDSSGISGRQKPRVSTTASTASLTVNADTTDLQNVTALAVNMTINAPTGTPVDGQLLKFFINDNGVARTLTWNAIFHGNPLTITSVGKVIHLWFVYNTNTTSWDKIISAQF